jgi:hypothetical protein
MLGRKTTNPPVFGRKAIIVPHIGRKATHPTHSIPQHNTPNLHKKSPLEK